MQSGTRLSERYTLGERLGAGAHGTVWTGHDTVIDRPVTVKILDPVLAEDESVRERFRHTALEVANLAVVGIVDVYDCLEEPDPDGGMLVCHITERVDGRPLRELLAQPDALPPTEALALVAGVARALDAAHAAGVVHGAVKPENLIVDADGKVTIVDFGFLPPERSPYTAPELAADSAAADVYGLGAVLYECLTGQAPAADGDISPLLDEFDAADAAPIMKAMSSQANGRFASAGAFADACLRLEPVRREHPAPPVMPAPEDSRDEPAPEAATEETTTSADGAPPAPEPTADDHNDTGTSATSAAGGPTDEDDTEPATVAASNADDGEAEDGTGPVAATATVTDEAEDGVADAAVTETAGIPAPDAAEAAARDEPRRSLRNQALVICLLLAAIALATGVIHFTLPGKPTGAGPTPEVSSESSASDSPSPSASATGSKGSPNPAQPAPTSSSPTPSDSPTSGDDTVQVPFVVGMHVETAQTELSNKGFLVIVSEEGEGRQQCRVHDQSPGGGASAPSGSTVTISVRRVNNPQQCIDPTS